MPKSTPYESEVDALMRKLREDPLLERQRRSNWASWWFKARDRARDLLGSETDAPLLPMERDMAVRERQRDVVGGPDR